MRRAYRICCLICLVIGIALPTNPAASSLSFHPEYIAVVRFTSCEPPALPLEEPHGWSMDPDDRAKAFVNAISKNPGVVVSVEVLSYRNILVDLPPSAVPERTPDEVLGPSHKGGFAEKYFLRNPKVSCSDLIGGGTKSLYSTLPCCDVIPPVLPECWLDLRTLEPIPTSVQDLVKKSPEKCNE